MFALIVPPRVRGSGQVFRDEGFPVADGPIKRGYAPQHQESKYIMIPVELDNKLKQSYLQLSLSHVILTIHNDGIQSCLGSYIRGEIALENKTCQKDNRLR